MSGKEICPVCVISVGDSDKGIQCDDNCKRWFHSSCVKLSTAEYSRLSKDTNLAWKCSRDDCLNDSKQPMNVLIMQIATLSNKISDLTSKVDTLTSVPAKIDLIISEVDDIKKSLVSVEKRVSENENCIKILQDKVDNLADRPALADSSLDPEIMVGEVNERARRALNVMVYNLTESTDTNVNVRKKHDLGLVNKLFKSIHSELNTNGIMTFRVGRGRPGKSRPLKVVLNSVSDVRQILSGFSSELAAGVDQQFSSVKVSRDRTQREQDYFKALKVEMNEREKKGEKDLTIKYKNGIPHIVKVSKN